MTRKKDKDNQRGRYRNHNPAESAKQYRLAQAVLSGYSDLMPVSVARDIVESTPSELRSEYMRNKSKISRRMHNSSTGEEVLGEATRVSEGFHGRPARYIEDVIEIEKYRTNLAHLGDLVEFEILNKSGRSVTPINFAEHDTDDHVSVGSTPDRFQIILTGGDQRVDLDTFDDISEEERNKDYVNLGEVFSISYFTDKHHLEGPKYQKDGTEYIHKFGEEGGERPTLVYDKLNQRMILIGGSYEVRDDGIYN
jgi:hypothetical protein